MESGEDVSGDRQHDAAPEVPTDAPEASAGPAHSAEQKDAERADPPSNHGARSGDTYDVSGHGNLFIFGRMAVGSDGDDWSLMEWFSNLDPPSLSDPGATTFLQGDLQAQARSLRADRLLLISCSDSRIASGAARALIEVLRAPLRHCRLLNFDSLLGRVPSVYRLFPRGFVADEEITVLIPATTDTAQPFIDSLYAGTGAWAGRDIRQRLRDCRMTVICIVDPDRLRSAQARGTDPQRFVCWRLSPLQYLLRPHFPDRHVELEIEIRTQRAAGRWSRDDSEFRMQIAAALERGNLEELVSQGGPATDGAERLPESDEVLDLAVLYVATYFPYLSAGEFGRIVEVVLGEQTQFVPTTVQQRTTEGTLETVELRVERRAIDIWHERADRVLREGGLITGSNGTKRVVTFADIGRRSRLRKLFDEELGVFVLTRFLTVHERGLLFDPSEDIGRAVIALTLDTTSSDSSETGLDWLHGWIASARQHAHDSPIVLRRVSELLRAMLGETRLAPLVTDVLKRLVQSAQHEWALELLKKLRFTPGFDTFPWIRQIIDQGTEGVAESAELHLARELRQAIRIHPLLLELEKWLPADGRAWASYSRSSVVALRRVFEHCLEATAELSQERDHPSRRRFSLLATDAETTPEDHALLLRWLLRPDLKRVAATRLPAAAVDLFVPAQVAEIAFFLDREAHGAPDHHASPSFDESLRALIDGLLEVIREDPAEQRRMVQYWETLRSYLAVAPSRGWEGATQKHEYARKRDVTRKLIAEFRRVQRERKNETKKRDTA